jgi:hypothetical protein
MKMDRYCFLIIVLISLVAMGNLLSAQEIDSRRWSIAYWQHLAEQGLVTVTPPDETAPQTPQIPDSRIHAKIVLIDDSPDVPVTTQTNVTQSENSIFINPLNDQEVLNSNNSSLVPITYIGNSQFRSTDGGLNWNGTLRTVVETRGDPAVAIDLNQRFYVGNLTDVNFGQGVAYSTDHGANWTHVQVYPADTDKNHLWVDNSPSSPYEGNLYSVWTDFTGGVNDGEIAVSRSTDNGLSWSAAAFISSAVNAGSHNQGCNVQTGPNGEVYVVWAIYDSWPSRETALGLAKSTDGGATWAPAVRIISNIRGVRAQTGGALGGGKTMRTASFPSMTVSSSGDIYAVWPNEGVPGVNTGDFDIYMIKSTDGGTTWGTPIRVNQDPIGNGKDQWQSWIACDPSTGFLACVFYDSRNFAANDQAETFVAVSTDEGNTWEDFKVSDVSWPADGFPLFSGNYAGDYIGIDILNGRVYPVWTDVRGGQLMAWVSPFLLADPTDPNPPSDFDAYSDYNTPTSMALTWSDPTNLANGDTLLSSEFQINILRNNVSIDSVAGGTEQYTDNGLTDGVSYTYTLFTKMLTNDSTSLGVNASWLAGGSPIPNGPTTFYLTNASGGQLMAHWTNPSDNVDGTPMDDFDAINLYEDGSLLTTFTRSPADTGSVDSALFTPGGANLPYYATAVDNESPGNESAASNSAYPPFVAPYSQDFEAGGALPVQWTNEQDDDFDWTPNAGGTSSSGTGPTVDHTLGTPAGYYMYTEASSPNFPNKIAHLTTPFIDLGTVSQPGMAFWYHMYGAAMGELHVDVYANGMWNLDAMTPLVGQQQLNQTDPWLQAVVDLSAYSGAPVQVRFRGITGSNYTSDMAIDDVFFGSLAANPSMAVAPLTISDTLLVGATSMHTVTVSNLAILPTSLNYIVTESPAVNWLSVVPTSGTVTSGQSEILDVTLDGTGISAGIYNTDLIISGNDTTNIEDTVTVSLVVNEAPSIAVFPDTFDVSLAIDTMVTDTMTIYNNGAGPLDFEIVIGGNLPELMYYKFNEAGSNQTQNFAAPGSPVPATANVLGLTMGGTGYEGSALIGNGGSSSSNYVDTGWITNLGTGPWTISLWLNNVDASTTLYYHFGDNSASSFRCFSGGVAGAGNLLLRQTGTGVMNDVLVTGVAPGPSVVDFVYDAAVGEIRAYLNGVLNNTVAQPALNIVGSANFKVGGYSTSTGLASGELMDEFKMFDRAIDLATAPESQFWLSADTTSGIIAPGDNMGITLTFDAAGLTGGDYDAEILVKSNDPVNPEVRIGAHMLVEDSVTSITELDPLPTTFAISQNYPNPFNPTTTFKYQLPEVADVKLVVYNILGQKVRTLINRSVEPGYHTAEWNGLNDSGKQVATGLYIYRFSADNYLRVQRMILMK